MRRVQLIHIGPSSDTLINNLYVSLGKIQDWYQFDLDNETIHPDPSKMESNIYPEDYLFGLMREYMSRKGINAYPMGICDLQLHDDLFSSNDSKEAIISSHGWAEISSQPVEKGMQYIIASILPDINHENTYVHPETRGCPNDFCDELSDINKGIQKGEYCHKCNQDLFSAIEKGNLTWAELTAIRQILDNVAGRRICFVIMPFKREFNPIYKIIQTSLKAHSFECVRGDKIFQTRSIMNIVNEMIKRSELIVADLTGRNPNVFYELGFAHALGKNSILIAQKTSDVPFDLRHRQYFIYNPKKNLETLLSHNIENYLTNKGSY